MARLRSNLYWAARFLGDVNAAQRGRLPQRLVRKRVYRATNRGLYRALKKGGLG